jgi:hypothetical protein
VSPLGEGTTAQFDRKKEGAIKKKPIDAVFRNNKEKKRKRVKQGTSRHF